MHGSAVRSSDDASSPTSASVTFTPGADGGGVPTGAALPVVGVEPVVVPAALPTGGVVVPPPVGPVVGPPEQAAIASIVNALRSPIERTLACRRGEA
jgi:hypothetical protein